jgi:hypothetical protein
MRLQPFDPPNRNGKIAARPLIAGVVQGEGILGVLSAGPVHWKLRVDVEKEVTREPKAVSPVPSALESGEPRVNGTPARGIRYATDEQFKKAQTKTSTLHAGLFRRLAK